MSAHDKWPMRFKTFVDCFDNFKFYHFHENLAQIPNKQQTKQKPPRKPLFDWQGDVDDTEKWTDV